MRKRSLFKGVWTPYVLVALMITVVMGYYYGRTGTKFQSNRKIVVPVVANKASTDPQPLNNTHPEMRKEVKDLKLPPRLSSAQQARIEKAKMIKREVKARIELLREVSEVLTSSNTLLEKIDIERKALLKGDNSHQRLRDLSPDELRTLEDLSEQETMVTQKKFAQIMRIKNKI